MANFKKVIIIYIVITIIIVANADDRCQFNSPAFQHHNNALIASFAGQSVALPNQLWQQDVHIMVQNGPDGGWIEMANYTTYLYNWWHQEQCRFSHEEYKYVIKSDGSIAIHIENTFSTPLAITYRNNHGVPTEAMHEYHTYWAMTPASFANIFMAASKSNHIATDRFTISSTYAYTGAGRFYVTKVMDILEPNYQYETTIMISPQNRPVIWIYIDSVSIDFPPLFAAARDAFLAGTIPFQSDPDAAMYGIDNHILIWDIPIPNNNPINSNSNNIINNLNITEIANFNKIYTSAMRAMSFSR